jgi:hypothetical protein
MRPGISGDNFTINGKVTYYRYCSAFSKVSLIDWGTEKSAKQKDGDTMEDALGRGE